MFHFLKSDMKTHSALDQCDDIGRAIRTTYAHALTAAAGSQGNH